jgi:fructose-1,6-bisphosphatase I/sedoheptulose-1,7-bisphosphatase
MPADRIPLARFLHEDRGGIDADLAALLLDIARACAAIAARVARGALGVGAATGSSNVHGERQHDLDLAADALFAHEVGGGGRLAGLVSEERADPLPLPAGRYLLLVDPLDGSSNIDVNVSVGSIFGVLRAPGRPVGVADFTRPGTAQVCAGYAIYGPSTVLVLGLPTGVHAFTLDPATGEFLLTRAALRIPPTAAEFAINVSNRRFWEPPVRHYVDDCLAGRAGPRGRDFNLRWVASLVAETHRILTRGGVFLYPRDTRHPDRPGRLRLLYEANPVALLVELAGGRASTGRDRVLDVAPTGLHQRVPLVFGAAEEVELVERHHRADPADAPLYAHRGLFRTPA